MNSKVIAYGIIGIFLIIGWNLIIIQRDNRMFDAFEKKLAIELMKNPLSNSLREWCKRQADWHPDCNLK
jgi:hypothetical protein